MWSRGKTRTWNTRGQQKLREASTFAYGIEGKGK